MSTLTEKQYRPIAYRRVGEYAPLTVAIANQAARNINNFKGQVGVDKIISESWSIGCEMTSLPVYPTWHTAEYIRMPFCPAFVPQGYTRMLVQSVHQRVTGAGSTTWRLYVLNELVGINDPVSLIGVDDFIFPIPYLWMTHIDLVDYDIHSWSSSSDSYALESSIFDCGIRDNNNRVWMVLTSENSDDTTSSRLMTLDVTPLLPG